MITNTYPPEGGIMGNEFVYAFTSSYEMLEKAEAEGLILEGRAVRCDGYRDLYVKMPGGITGVIPYSEAIYEGGGKVRDIAVISRVGKPVCFTVTNAEAEIPLLSRRNAQKECFENKISALEPGTVTDAVVTHLEPFGAFCDIGCGIIALMPIDTMSVSRITHPADRFKVGQKIRAVVKSRDDEGRITLSHKELLGTWEENAEMFPAGQAVTGIVRSIEKYGIFVELAPNLAGLAEYRDGFDAGDTVSVYIKSVIPQKMKVKLIIIDKAENEKPDYVYTYDDTEYIDRWQYSPESADRIIESVFQK